MEDLLYLASQAAKENMDWHGIEDALSSFVIPMSRTGIFFLISLIRK